MIVPTLGRLQRPLKDVSCMIAVMKVAQGIITRRLSLTDIQQLGWRKTDKKLHIY
jgi:hypothetical protein